MQPPVKWENYNREAALDLAAMGRPITQIASTYGSKNVRTIWSHLKKDAVFKEARSQARECGYFVVADSILTIHEEFPEANPVLLRVISENRMWWLSKLYPSVFGDKIQVQVEHVDLKGALSEARTRVITLTSNTTKDSFSLDQSPGKP